MKCIIISDIHGGIYELNKVLEIFSKEHCDKLLLLGDLFNYGLDLNMDDIVNMLNLIKDNIIAVSGNCDNHIKNILFDMPYINELNINNKKTMLTHGHLYTKEQLLNSDYEIIITGHTHRPVIEYENNKLFINPGSITKSRSGENTFILIDDKIITLRNLNNQILSKNFIK